MHKFQAMGLQGLMGAWGFEWFELRLYPLIQDLVGAELSATEVDEEFIGELRMALEGMEPRPCARPEGKPVGHQTELMPLSLHPVAALLKAVEGSKAQLQG